jgi:hypothetical protein
MALRDDRCIPDLEERIVMAFLEAVHRISRDDPPAKVAGYLKNATDWAVFPRWRGEEPKPEEVPFDDGFALDEGSVAEDAICTLIDVARVLDAEPNREEIVGVLMATLADDEPLFAFLGRTRPALSTSEKWRTYRRLTKQRDRVMKDLRVRLGVGNLQQVLGACTLRLQGTNAA